MSVIYYSLQLAHEWSFSARLISRPVYTPGWGMQRELFAGVGGCGDGPHSVPSMKAQ